MAIQSLKLYQDIKDPSNRQLYVNDPTGKVDVYSLNENQFAQLRGLGLEPQTVTGTYFKAAGGGQNYSADQFNFETLRNQALNLGDGINRSYLQWAPQIAGTRFQQLAEQNGGKISLSDADLFELAKTTRNPGSFGTGELDWIKNYELFKNANFSALPTTANDLVIPGVNDLATRTAQGAISGGRAALEQALVNKGLPAPTGGFQTLTPTNEQMGAINNTLQNQVAASEVAQATQAPALPTGIPPGSRKLGPTEFNALRLENNVSPANFDQFFAMDKEGNIYLKPQNPSTPGVVGQGEGTVAGGTPPSYIAPTKFEIKAEDYLTVDSDMYGQAQSRIDTDWKVLLDEISQGYKGYIDLLSKKSSEEVSLETQIANLRESAAKGINEALDQAIPLAFTTGQAASIERKAQAIEANLLTRLGLAKEDRNQKIKAAEAGIAASEQKLDTYFKIKDRIQDQEDKILERAQDLRDEAKSTLGTILKSFSGSDFEDFDLQTQQSLANLAAKAGIPLDLLVSSLKAEKDAILAEQAMPNIKQVGNSLVQIMDDGSVEVIYKNSSTSGGGSNTESVADMQAQIDNYALQKSAGQDVPEWVDQYLVPEFKDGIETGKYNAMKITEGSLPGTIASRETAEQMDIEEQKKQLADPEFVAQSIIEDRNNNVGYEEIRNAAFELGVTPEVYRQALRLVIQQGM